MQMQAFSKPSGCNLAIELFLQIRMYSVDICTYGILIHFLILNWRNNATTSWYTPVGILLLALTHFLKKY